MNIIFTEYSRLKASEKEAKQLYLPHSLADKNR